jgi:hypothetical protein
MTASGDLRTGLLTPLWRFTASGVIWRLVAADGGRIVGEDRDLERKKTSFFCLDETTGAVGWKGRSYGEDWWVGIEAVERDTMYLHGFATPAMPGHRGVVAVDVGTGERLWEAEQVRFIRASAERVLVESPDASGSTLCELESRTGRIIEQIPHNRQWGRADEAHTEQQPDASVKAPLPLEFLRELSPAAMLTLETEKSKALEGVCDSGYLVLALQEGFGSDAGAPGCVNQRIVAIHQASGRVAYRDALETGVSSSVRPTFFVRQHLLQYVKERMSLIAVRLLPEG